MNASDNQNIKANKINFKNPSKELTYEQMYYTI